mmetsp:Transcript_33869/g.54664  ORF Transcript_33869/g.54664 Transcript_33869/m.54664 type:complete len:163 (+) Transcript_33869:556-1044(+)
MTGITHVSNENMPAVTEEQLQSLRETLAARMHQVLKCLQPPVLPLTDGGLANTTAHATRLHHPPAPLNIKSINTSQQFEPHGISTASPHSTRRVYNPPIQAPPKISSPATHTSLEVTHEDKRADTHRHTHCENDHFLKGIFAGLRISSPPLPSKGYSQGPHV